MLKQTITGVFICLLILLSSSWQAALAQQKMYFLDSDDNEIYRSNLDGSDIDTLVTGQDLVLASIALNVIAEKMYWTTRNTVSRANLDGSDVEVLVSGLDFPSGIALDVGAGKTYWAEGEFIKCADLEGNNVVTLITEAFNATIRGIALDITGEKIYWVDRNRNRVKRADLDGNNKENLINLGIGAAPTDIALDLTNGKMYFTESATSNPRIGRANLDGSDRDTLVTNARDPLGIALDVGNNKMYFGDGHLSRERIRSANLNGGGQQTIVNDLGFPSDIVLDLRVPEISVSPLSHDLGQVEIGSNASQTITIENNGTETLNVSGVSQATGSSDWSEDGSSVSIAPNNSATFDITFAPTSVGSQTATFEITSNDPDESTATVTCQGEGVAPNIVVSPLNHDVGQVTIGDNASQTITIENTGATTLNVSDISQATGGSDWSEDGVTESIAPNESATFDITFAPTSAGSQSATFEISSDDPDSPTVTVTCNGEGVAALEPNIVASPLNHDIGEVAIGDNASQTITIENTGTATLNVSDISQATGSSDWSEDGGAVSIAPSNSATFDITFTPSSSGSQTATFEISSNDPDSPTVTITCNGEGVEAPVMSFTPSSADLGPVTVGNTNTQNITSENTGSGPMTIFSMTFNNNAENEFSIIPQLPPPGAFPMGPAPAGSERTFQIKFTPINNGPESGSLVIESDAPSSPTILNFSAEGTGLPKQLPPRPEVATEKSLHISDALGYWQELYFDVALQNTAQKAWFKLPPVIANQVFDARFSDDNLLSEGKEAIIKLHGDNYPVFIDAANLSEQGEGYILEELSGDVVVATHELREGQLIEIADENIKTLRLRSTNDTETQLPQAFALNQNYPNPFNPTTNIEFAISNFGFVELKVYDTVGRLVKTLVNENRDAGIYSVQWDATNDFGQRIASGIYLYKLQAADFVQVKKMILLK